MRIKFVRVDEIDRKKLALNLAKLSQKRTEKGSRAGDLLARMGTHKFNPAGASTGPLKEPVQGGRGFKAERLAKRASFFRKKGLSTPGQANPGTAGEREAALRQGEERGRNRRGMNRAMRQNSSTEILGNKMVEGFNKLFQEATISKSRGKGKGEIVRDVKLSKGALEALKKRGKRVPGGWTVPSKGNRLPTEIADSTEILGNKIVEGFDSLLNELNRAERAIASGEVSQKTKNRYMRKRRKGDFQETPDAWTDQVNRIHGTNTPPQGSGRYASANRAKNKARKKKKKVPVIVPTQSTKKGPGKQTGPLEGRGLKR